jgi:hypothetical protein
LTISILCPCCVRSPFFLFYFFFFFRSALIELFARPKAEIDFGKCVRAILIYCLALCRGFSLSLSLSPSVSFSTPLNSLPHSLYSLTRGSTSTPWPLHSPFLFYRRFSHFELDLKELHRKSEEGGFLRNSQSQEKSSGNFQNGNPEAIPYLNYICIIYNNFFEYLEK